jgi:hypothetical protein
MYEALHSPGQPLDQTTRAFMERRFGHDFSRIPVHSPATETIQTKLTISEPGDHYEQEADSLADQVMRMPEPDIQSQQAVVSAVRHPSSSETIQCLAADKDPSLENATVVEEEEAESERGLVQTLRSQRQHSGREVASKDLLKSSQGGVPLAANVRRFMETRFGADFSGVRIHPDSHAAALSQSLSARAFTYGRHIYFGAGEYQPESQQGKRVLAHELTHVLQQGAGQSRLPVQQHVTENLGANVPRAIQRLSRLGKVLRHNVAPWGAGGPLGSDYEISTDGGSTVTGWQAYFVFQDQYRYWCHGHSLDSYANYDYSVYSGTPTATVMRDEWNNVPADQTRAGDIAVWTAGFDHSAKFTRPVIENGQLVPDKSELSTKNGQNALTTLTLNALAGIYGSSGVAVFRHK